MAVSVPLRQSQVTVLSMSLKLLFACPITGEEVDAYVFGPIERLVGTTADFRELLREKRAAQLLVLRSLEPE